MHTKVTFIVMIMVVMMTCCHTWSSTYRLVPVTYATSQPTERATLVNNDNNLLFYEAAYRNTHTHCSTKWQISSWITQKSSICTALKTWTKRCTPLERCTCWMIAHLISLTFWGREKWQLFYFWRGWKSIYILQDSQVMPGCPSDEHRMRVKTLGW